MTDRDEREVAPQKRANRWAVRSLIILLLVAGLLSVAVEGFLRRVVVVPALQSLVGLYRLYLVPPQALIWVGTLVIGALLMVRALWSWPLPRQPAPARPEMPGRVAKLASLIPKAETSDYFRWQLALELERLAVGAMQLAYRTPAPRVREAVLTGEIPVEPGLARLFGTCAAIPTYRRFVEERTEAGRKPIPALSDLDLMLALGELEAWFSLSQPEH